MSRDNSRVYEYTSVGEKTPIRVPEGYMRGGIALVPVDSRARVEHTYYPYDVVKLDPSVVTWHTWDAGDTNKVTEARLLGAPTALRVVVVSGDDVKLVVNFTNA
jgi:hypothetical protein